MDPTTLITLLGSIPGFFMKDNGLQQVMDQYSNIMNPTQLLNQTNKIYGGWLTSPARASSQAGALRSASGAASAAGQSVAARGLTGSGIGSIVNSVGHNMAGNMLGNLDANAWNSSANQANELLQGLARNSSFAKQPMSIPRNMYAGLLDWFSKNGKNLFNKGATPDQGLGANTTGGLFNGQMQDPFNALLAMLSGR